MDRSLPPLSETAKSLKVGLYKHFKGYFYQLLGVGRHSETREEFVIYQALYGSKDLWIRPVAMFCEKVNIDENIEVSRFSYVDNQEK